MIGGSKDGGVDRLPAGRLKEIQIGVGEEKEETGRNEHEGQDGAEQASFVGRDEVSPAPVVDAAEEEKDEKGVTGERCNEREDEAQLGEDFIHDAGSSLSLTGLLLLLVVVCGVRSGSWDWVHFTAFGGGYAVLFCCEWILGRGRGPSFGEAGPGVFLESRYTIALIGIGAFVFGSSALLEIAPDILVVAGIFGGSDDGRAARHVGRQFGVSLAASSVLLAAACWRGAKGGR